MRSLRPAVLLIGGLFLLLPAAAATQKLDGDDKRFLKEVGPIILSDEKAVFEKLDKADRLVFQEIFWARRDPDLATPENEFRQQYDQDRATADRRYSVPGAVGSATDCGRLFILIGEPDHVYRNEKVGEPDHIRRVAPVTGVVANDNSMKFGTRHLIDRLPETWIYEDRPERRMPIAQVEIVFDLERRGGANLPHVLDRIAATKIVHPNIDYEVGKDGHLVEPAHQLTTPVIDDSQ